MQQIVTHFHALYYIKALLMNAYQPRMVTNSLALSRQEDIINGCIILITELIVYWFISICIEAVF